jgi:hypothetical protein
MLDPVPIAIDLQSSIFCKKWGMVSLCFTIRLLHASHKAHQPLIVAISDQKMTWKAKNDLAMPCDFSRFHYFRKMVPAACHLKNDRGIGSGQVPFGKLT